MPGAPDCPNTPQVWHNGQLSMRPLGPAAWSCMSFKVGDRVVYPHHGAAIIKRKEERELLGEAPEYLVLEMGHGDLTLSVPSDKAEEGGVRAPISEADVEDLSRLIAKRDVREPANWSRRL